MAEGAPLLREYVGKTCIEGSNPSDSANHQANTGPSAPWFICTYISTYIAKRVCTGSLCCQCVTVRGLR